MSMEWDQYADHWDSNPDVLSYAKSAFATLAEVIELGGLRVLDFGCGTGLLTERMARLAREVVALDASAKMIAVLDGKQLPNVTPVAGLLSEEWLTDSRPLARPFDLIVASSVCAFLPDYERTLSLLATLLVPGGTLVQWDWLVTDAGAGYGFTEARVKKAYEQSGLLLQSLGQAFSLASAEGRMPVLMAVATAPARLRAEAR